MHENLSISVLTPWAEIGFLYNDMQYWKNSGFVHIYITYFFKTSKSNLNYMLSLSVIYILGAIHFSPFATPRIKCVSFNVH